MQQPNLVSNVAPPYNGDVEKYFTVQEAGELKPPEGPCWHLRGFQTCTDTFGNIKITCLWVRSKTDVVWAEVDHDSSKSRNVAAR